MTKIPHFFLAGAIPTDQVGRVLEAMYLAGAKQLDVRPLVAQKATKNGTKALPAPNGSVRARVLAFARERTKFTMADLKAAVTAGPNALHGAVHFLKHKKFLRASGPQMKRTYRYTGKKES